MNQEGFGGEKVSILKTAEIEVTLKAQFFSCYTSARYIYVKEKSTAQDCGVYKT